MSSQKDAWKYLDAANYTNNNNTCIHICILSFLYLLQSIKAIIQPEDLDNAMDSSASDSSFSSSDDEDEVDKPLSGIPLDEPLPEEMPIEDEEEQQPRMLFGDSEEEEEEDQEEEEDENDSDWEVKKDKKKGGKKSLGGKKRSKRGEEEESEEEEEKEIQEESTPSGRSGRRGRSVISKNKKDKESDEEEEEAKSNQKKKKRGKKSLPFKDDAQEESDSVKSKGKKGNRSSAAAAAATTPKSTRKGNKFTGIVAKEESDEEEEEEDREKRSKSGNRKSTVAVKGAKQIKKKQTLPQSEEEDEESAPEVGRRGRGGAAAAAAKGKKDKALTKSTSKTRGKSNKRGGTPAKAAESETSAAETDEGTDLEASVVTSSTTTTSASKATTTATTNSAINDAAAAEETGRGRRRKSVARRLAASVAAAADPNDSDSSVSTSVSTTMTTSTPLPSRTAKSSSSAAAASSAGGGGSSTRRESMRKSGRDRKTPRKFSPTSSNSNASTTSRSLNSKDASHPADDDETVRAVNAIDSSAAVVSDPLIDYEADDDSRTSSFASECLGADASSSKVSSTSSSSSKKKTKKGEKKTVWSFLTEKAQEDGGADGAEGKLAGMTIEDVKKAFEGGEKRAENREGRGAENGRRGEAEVNAPAESIAAEKAGGCADAIHLDGTSVENSAAVESVSSSNCHAIEMYSDASVDATKDRNQVGIVTDGNSEATSEDLGLAKITGIGVFQTKVEEADSAISFGGDDSIDDAEESAIVQADRTAELAEVPPVKTEDVKIESAEQQQQHAADKSSAVDVKTEAEEKVDVKVGDVNAASNSCSPSNSVAAAANIPVNFVGPIETEIPPPKISEPDLTTFELVAESIDSLKALIRKLKKDPNWEPAVKEVEVEEEEEEEGEKKSEEEKKEKAKSGEKEEGKISLEKKRDEDKESSSLSKTSSPEVLLCDSESNSRMDADSDDAGSNAANDNNNAANDDGKSSSKNNSKNKGKTTTTKSAVVETKEEKREMELVEKLEELMTELAPFERKLNDASRRMRVKLQKDVLEFKEQKTSENDAEGNAAWDSDIDDDDQVRNNTPSLSYDDNSNDPYYVGGDMSMDGGRQRSLRANPRPSKRKLEMDRENAMILQGVADEYTDLYRSEEFDIVEVSSRGRVRKVRRLGISEENEKSAANGSGGGSGTSTPKTASGRPARNASRKSTPLMESDEEEDMMDEELSNSSMMLDPVTKPLDLQGMKLGR